MNTQKIKILNSQELRTIQVKDNHEIMVDLKDVCPLIRFNIPEYIKLHGGEKAMMDARYVRKEVAGRLKKAQSLLPNDLYLCIDTAYRSPTVQQKSYDAVYSELQDEYPKWNIDQLQIEMDNRVSPVDIAPHCTGGAVDLTIVNKNNIPIRMGTELDEYNEKTFTDFSQISLEEKGNRELLKKVMLAGGFINFPAEWWHWSYGDREWAYNQKDKIAIYGPIEKLKKT